MKLKYKLLAPNAKPPRKAHTTDAGFDLTCTRIDYDARTYTYHTDVAFEIPAGHFGLLLPRSSSFRTNCYLANAAGVIDEGFRNEVTMKFRPDAALSPAPYEVGDRIGQLLILPVPDITLEEADTLSESERGTGGYGSTGR